MIALQNRGKLDSKSLNSNVHGYRKTTRRHVVQSIWGGEERTPTGHWEDGKFKRNAIGLREKVILFSCSQQKCSKMKERLDSHRLGHHMGKVPGTSKTVNEAGNTGTQSQRNTESKLPPLPPQPSDTSSTQKDSINNKDSEIKSKPKRKKIVEIPLRSSETKNLLAPKKNFYKQHLQDEIVKWFLNTPTFSDIDNEAEFLKLKVINNLVDNVADLSVMVKNENYDKEVRHEVEYCLDVILMKYNNSKMPKGELKDKLCRTLLQKIAELNEKWLNVKKEQKKGSFTTVDLITFPFDDEILKNEIVDWVDAKLKITCSGIKCGVHKNIIIGVLTNRLIPIIKSKTKNKSDLQTEIKRIINDFSAIIILPKKNRSSFINELAIDLTDTVTNRKTYNNTKAFLDGVYVNKDDVTILHSYSNIMKHKSPDNESCSVELFNVPRLTDDSQEDTINQITEILFESIDSVVSGHGEKTVKEISGVLKSSGEFSEDEATTLASSLVTNVKTSVNQDLNIGISNPRSSGMMVVLTSEQDLSGPFMKDQPLTSTPLLPVQKKKVQNLNPVEKAYMDKVAEVVTAWLDTTDVKFETNEEQFFKMTIANDIAGDVQNLAKLSQIQENMIMSNYEGILCFIIMRAIEKYGLIAKPASFKTPQVADLKKRILKLGMPDMMMPQQDNRQNMGNIKFRSGNPTREKFQPDALDVLEDKISVWMNEQPSEIYKDKGRIKRKKSLRNVAKKVQQNMEKDKNETEIKKVLAQWLKGILNTKYKKDVDTLAEELKKRVMKLPQNETTRIRKTVQKKGKASAGEDTDIKPEQYSNVLADPDIRPKELIEQLIEHNYDDFVNFIEGFVDLKSKAIGDDEELMEAYVASLLKEIRKIIQDKEDVLTIAQVHDRLANVPLPGKESVKRLNQEMRYAKEIAEWLHNFPLKPLKTEEDDEKRFRMISELSVKMIETDQKKAKNPYDGKADAELDEYIANWISQLDLEPHEEMVEPILISQLKKRMMKVNEDSEKKRQPPPEIEADIYDKSKINKYKIQRRDQSSTPGNTKSVSVCNTNHKPEDPGDLMVEAIESWCKNLPVTEENEDSTKATKEKVAIDLLKKIGSLNDDPQIANDDLLFKEMLTDEVDAELENLSVIHHEIKLKKNDLKESLLEKVMNAKKVIRNISAGENYKEALENTIDASLPNPSVFISSKNDPGFELYKHRMAMLWLLENYDYAKDFYSIRYKKKLMEDIDNYSDQAQKRNVFQMEKKEFFNEIFSSLYKQKPPSENSIIEEVENIKTRCEIDAWFKELPLNKAYGFEELLERDQILAILAKRLFDIERSKDPDADQKMQKEILKWLKRLPLLPDEGKNLSKYAKKLICLLKATVDERKCIRQPFKTLVKQYGVKCPGLNNIKEGTILPNSKKGNVSQVAGPSEVKLQPCCKDPTVPRKKAGDLITSAIETWCRQLPLRANNPEEEDFVNNIKDEAVLKLYQLLSDLNADPHILNSDGLYEHHLQLEIERILSELPNYWEDQRTRNARRAQLVKELKAVRPLIKDEMDREGYKQNLKHAITSFFDETTTPNKILVNDIAKTIMIDNFLEYSFNEGEYENQQIFKNKMDDSMAEVIKKNAQYIDLDPLVMRNKLICKMAKVKQPKESALTDEVQEIRMKNEITELFKELNIPEDDDTRVTHREQMKLVLAKKLMDIERAGHTCANDMKMKIEIFKAIKKLGAEINPAKVDTFVNRLKENEDARRAPPPKKMESCACIKNSHSHDQKENRHVPSGPSLVLRSPQQTFSELNGRYPPHPRTQSPQMISRSPRISQFHIPCNGQGSPVSDFPRNICQPNNSGRPPVLTCQSIPSQMNNQSPRISQFHIPCNGQGSPVSNFPRNICQPNNSGRPPVLTCQSNPSQMNNQSPRISQFHIPCNGQGSPVSDFPKNTYQPNNAGRHPVLTYQSNPSQNTLNNQSPRISQFHIPYNGQGSPVSDFPRNTSQPNNAPPVLTYQSNPSKMNNQSPRISQFHIPYNGQGSPVSDFPMNTSQPNNAPPVLTLQSNPSQNTLNNQSPRISQIHIPRNGQGSPVTDFPRTTSQPNNAGRPPVLTCPPNSAQNTLNNQSPRISQFHIPYNGQGSPVTDLPRNTSQPNDTVLTSQSRSAQNTSNNQSPRILPIQPENPDFRVVGPRTSLRPPESNQTMRINVQILNIPLESSEQTGCRTIARVQGSGAESSEDWNCPNSKVDSGTDTELDRLECECERDRKKKGCRGPCQADELEYCDECDSEISEHDCDYVMYPFPIPGCVYLI